MKAYDIRTKFPVQSALNLKQAFATELNRIKSDPMLSYEGKKQKIAKIKHEFAIQIFEYATEEKKKYIKLANEATEIAKQIKVQQIEQPAEVEIKLFEQALNRMESDVMLAVNEERAIEKLDVFVKDFATEPYFANIIIERFGAISLNILNIKSSPVVREALNKIREILEAIVTTPEILLANEALERFVDAQNVKIFRHNTPALNTVGAIIGNVASHLVDDPARGLAILKGEVRTFANNKGMHVVQ